MTGVVTPDEWSVNKWTHEAVMTMQARLAPADIDRMAADWKMLVGELDSLYCEFLADVSRLLHEGWGGRGADAVSTQLRAYVANSRSVFAGANSLSEAMTELSDAGADLRNRITPPLPADEFESRSDLLGSRGAQVTANSALSRALSQVVMLYSGPAIRAADSVGPLTGPQERVSFGWGRLLARQPVADELGSPAEEFLHRNAPEQSEPDRPANASLPPQAQTLPGAGPPTSAGMPTPQPPVNALPADDAYSSQDRMRDPLQRESQTRAAAIDSPMDSEGLAQRRPLAPDRSIPGLPSTPPTSASGGLSVRGAASMGPFMGAYPGNAGQHRGNENEHRTPHYLVNADNTRELIGELPKASLPVIGLWEEPRPRRKKS